MELSPRQRSAVFALVVIALAALGYYLVVPAVTHSHRPAASTTGRATSGPTATAPDSAAAAAPTVAASAADAGGPDI